MFKHTDDNSRPNFGSQASELAYKNHAIFQHFDKYIKFYDRWSSAVFLYPTLGTKAICNIDSYVFSSIQGTLCSIKLVLEGGWVNDAWALLRKYNDSIIINIYCNLFLKDNFSIDNFLVDRINGWLSGESKIPEYRIMSQYIREHRDIHDLNHLLYNTDDRYKKIRERCNDHSHYNYFKAMLINNNEIYLESRINHLNQMDIDLRDLFIMHLAFIFCIQERYMASSDYVDYLDCGDTPPEGSQYWVAPFIQEIFSDVLMSFRSDIAALIKNKVSMYL